MDPQIPGKYQQRVTEPVYEAGRHPLTEESFRKVYGYEPEIGPTILEKVKEGARCNRKSLYKFLPLTKWLLSYRKEDFLPDVMSGLTVAVMHIPQGMAYALLAGVPPVVGIYMALFPVLVYIVMGTSRHISMGSFAVVCMMASKSVDRYSHGHSHEPSLNSTFYGGDTYSPVEVAASLSFVAGIWQVVLGIFKLGSLSVLLSDTLVSGFTTGAAVHVFTSQVKSLLGLNVKRYTGPFKIIYTYYDIFAGLGKVNYVALVISACTLATLVAYNEVIRPRIQKLCKRNVPLPVELIIVIVGTLLSVQFNLKNDYGVAIVNDVPTGLPSPFVPPFRLMPNLLVDGLVIGIIAISISISMAKIFAKKLNYKIDGNQEILAYGLGNVFGSFFSCLPYSASLSRSLIQESAGGRTQLANAVSCVILLLVLLFIAPFFEPLPYCVLSSIIVVALKGMFLQFCELPRIIRLSKLNGFVWLVSCMSVVILDIDYGLGMGVIASIGTMVFRGQSSRIAVLGRVPGTCTFSDRRLFKRTEPTEDMLVIRVIGGLHFANVEPVRNQILREVFEYQKCGFALVRDPAKPVPSLAVVLVMSSVPYMDPSAVLCLGSVCSDLGKANVDCVLCEFLPSVYDTLQHCNFFDGFPQSKVFPSATNAIEYLERSMVQGSAIRIIPTIS